MKYENFLAMENALEDDFDEFELETDDYDEDEYCPLSEEEEMALAAELMAVTDEDELEQFLGKLFKRIGRGIKKVVRSPLFKKVGGVLRGVAKVALPIAAKVAGTAFGGPVGGMIGGKLGSLASGLFETELGHLPPEEMQFEFARRLVRYASSAAHRAARAPRHLSPRAIAYHAAKTAARRFIPGLRGLGRYSRQRRRTYQQYPYRSKRSLGRQGGRWIRRGRCIVIFS